VPEQTFGVRQTRPANGAIGPEILVHDRHPGPIIEDVSYSLTSRADGLIRCFEARVPFLQHDSAKLTTLQPSEKLAIVEDAP